MDADKTFGYVCVCGIRFLFICVAVIRPSIADLCTKQKTIFISHSVLQIRQLHMQETIC